MPARKRQYWRRQKKPNRIIQQPQKAGNPDAKRQSPMAVFVPGNRTARGMDADGSGESRSWPTVGSFRVGALRLTAPAAAQNGSMGDPLLHDSHAGAVAIFLAARQAETGLAQMSKQHVLRVSEAGVDLVIFELHAADRAQHRSRG
jgi:hypothetical protein